MTVEIIEVIIENENSALLRGVDQGAAGQLLYHAGAGLLFSTPQNSMNSDSF